MKGKIICFSQTGNTRLIAQDIAQGIEDAGHECQVSEMLGAAPADTGDCDILGIGCPVFFYKEPFNVADFMDNLPPGNGKHAFIFITHGSVPGVTLESMWKRLADNGYLVLGASNTYADAFLPFYPYPTLTTGHPDQQDRDQARTFGKHMAEISQRIAAGESGLAPGPITALDGWWKDEAVMLSRETLAQVMPKLSINPDKCIQCLECQDACPAGGIDVTEDPPRIQEPCVFCVGCARDCPEQAIEADWSMLVSMAPANYQRYRAALEEAAARGEFRWLMDPDTINCDDPLYKQKEKKLAEQSGDTK